MNTLPVVGDKVVYSPKYIRSRRLDDAPAAKAKGKLTAIQRHDALELAVVKWESGDNPVRVNRANLATAPRDVRGMFMVGSLLCRERVSVALGGKR